MGKKHGNMWVNHGKPKAFIWQINHNYITIPCHHHQNLMFIGLYAAFIRLAPPPVAHRRCKAGTVVALRSPPRTPSERTGKGGRSSITGSSPWFRNIPVSIFMIKSRLSQSIYQSIYQSIWLNYGKVRSVLNQPIYQSIWENKCKNHHISPPETCRHWRFPREAAPQTAPPPDGLRKGVEESQVAEVEPGKGLGWEGSWVHLAHAKASQKNAIRIWLEMPGPKKKWGNMFLRFAMLQRVSLLLHTHTPSRANYRTKNEKMDRIEAAEIHGKKTLRTIIIPRVLPSDPRPKRRNRGTFRKRATSWGGDQINQGTHGMMDLWGGCNGRNISHRIHVWYIC